MFHVAGTHRAAPFWRWRAPTSRVRRSPPTLQKRRRDPHPRRGGTWGRAALGASLAQARRPGPPDRVWLQCLALRARCSRSGKWRVAPDGRHFRTPTLIGRSLSWAGFGIRVLHALRLELLAPRSRPTPIAARALSGLPASRLLHGSRDSTSARRTRTPRGCESSSWRSLRLRTAACWRSSRHGRVT